MFAVKNRHLPDNTGPEETSHVEAMLNSDTCWIFF